MRKRTCALTIVLLLIAGPVLAADQADNRAAGLRATVAWVLGLLHLDLDVERTAPEAQQRHGADIVVEGSTSPARDGSASTPHGSGAIDG